MRLVALLLLVDMEEEDELVELVVTLEVLVLWLVHAAAADDTGPGGTVSLERSLGEATAATAAALLVISFSRLLSFSQLSRLFRLFMLLKIICSDSPMVCSFAFSCARWTATNGRSVE
uniref:Putative secreted protein n=1 Tax=Anopheles triannulatus TaxID=58253 RepID=A0A2M4B391_9DIPT